MKKSIVAAGIIVALGAGWAVAEWQTGKTIEQNKDVYTVKANEQMSLILSILISQDKNLAYMMPKLKLTLDSYDRGVLSSTARYYMSEVGQNNNEKIYFTAKIEHGPFPLSELASFNLAPKGAVINVELDNTELTKPIFDVTKGKSPFLLKIVPGAGSSRGELSIPPIEYQGIKLENTKLQIIADNALTKIESSGNIGTFGADLPEGTLKIDSLSFNSDFKEGKFINYIGNQNLKIKSFAFKTKKSFPPIPELKFENIRSNSTIKEDTVDIQYTTHMEFGSIKLGDNDFGTIKVGADLSKVDGEAFKNFTADINQHASELQNNPELMQEIVLDHFEGLLKSSPIIKIAPISWTNKGGISNYSATLELNKISLAELETLPDEEIIGKVIKNLDSDLTISIPMLKDMAVTAIQASGMASKEDAAKQFDQSITQLPLLLKEYDKKGTLVVNKDRIDSKFNYNNGVVTLNGQKMPVAEFLNSLE